nr:nucleotidyltransferase [uncultured Acetatifactor sp.]
MKVNGIIAEYNPFHNGHKYHLEESRRELCADYTIIAMSGNFMQRGAPAIIDKYARAEMALKNGADLVLEIPSCYAASSAEYFATGAVSLLDKLGVVDHLCFGSECGDISVLKRIAQILLDEPDKYIKSLKSNLRQGLSYPNARTWALLQYDPALSGERDVLSSPNNILGIEYLKALLRRASNITPFTTIRVGADYHDRRLGENQSSALAIRQAVFSRQDFGFLENQMPESACRIMIEYLKSAKPVHINDFSAALHYKLLLEKEGGYDCYLDVSPDLSDRIRRNLFGFTSFKGFCDLLKSKDTTYTRISRCLLHILLDMKNSDMESYQAMDYIPYARVLGFRRDASPLLSAIKESSSVPLVTKLADAQKLLDAPAFEMLKQEVRNNHIYQSTLAMKSRKNIENEFSTPIVII